MESKPIRWCHVDSTFHKRPKILAVSPLTSVLGFPVCSPYLRRRTADAGNIRRRSALYAGDSSSSTTSIEVSAKLGFKSSTFVSNQSEMYHNSGAQPGAPRPPPNQQSVPFGNAFYGASSGLIGGGLGAYGEKILGSSSEYVQSNISRYFSDPQYYFQVNDHYVRNKLKIVLFPFLNRGQWLRISEPVGGKFSYKPPIYDINAPDLYIPFMVFGTYLVLAGFSLGLHGKFSPEALNWLFMKGIVGWILQFLLLKMSLVTVGTGEAPFLDIVAYAGYTFTGMCLAVLGRIIWSHSYYFLMPWTCLCMGIFLVKTMKRVLFSEARGHDSSKQHYLLLLIALAQFPLLIWLGNIGVHWLF